jgi:hypothetical protein
MLLKVKTQNTETLEQLISRIRLIDGVTRTETLVVLSTRLERTLIPLSVPAVPPVKKPNGAAPAREAKVSVDSE